MSVSLPGGEEVLGNNGTEYRKINGLFHRLRAPTLLPTLYHRVPPPGTPALSGSAAVPSARGVVLLLRASA